MNSRRASSSLESLAWPASRIGEALEGLALHSGLSSRTAPAPRPPGDLSTEEIDDWINAAAEQLGVETQSVEVTYLDLDPFVREAAPVLMKVPGAEGPAQFLALVRGGKRNVILLAPDLSLVSVAAEAVRDTLCGTIEAPHLTETDRILTEAGVNGSERTHARRAILREQLGGERIGDCWLVRATPSTDMRVQARQLRLPRRIITLVAAHLAQYVLWIVSWWLIGKGALQGRTDWGWLIAWVLLLFSLIPFRLFMTWMQGTVAILAGTLLKQRLLYGALQLHSEEVRKGGVGQFLGRVIECEAVESLALSGGFLALFALIELLVALVVLGFGAAAWQHISGLLVWIAIVLFLGWKYFRERQVWALERIAMTNDLVERMAGHRTRLAQEERERWHDSEDQMMQRYLAASERVDAGGARLVALVPRGWLVLGIAGLAPGFVLGTFTPATMAISFGGILLAFQALNKLAAGLSQLSDAAIAAKQVAHLFRAAERNNTVPAQILFRRNPTLTNNGQPLIEARGLGFQYESRPEPVLTGCHMRFGHRDRVLLEGMSGGGKSTLASVLAGLRAPTTGLLLLEGLDLPSTGAMSWRQRVATAPQFQENHVLTGTFAFNVLMGLRWPPRQEDFARAEEICEELGLGPVLKRMPAGLLQMVGESGWQLSQGERSRLYIARALLQDAPFVILDESFASLDPENMRRALQCVLNRARALLVIAHP